MFDAHRLLSPGLRFYHPFKQTLQGSRHVLESTNRHTDSYHPESDKKRKRDSRMDDDPRPGPPGRPSSTTRVYIGNLPPNVQKADVENHFNTHGVGKIVETKLMNGFGFLEYEDPLDARDVVPGMHGTDFMGQRLTVQFARGPRDRDTRGGPPPGATGGAGFYGERGPPRTRRTVYRMTMAGLPAETSWQDLKDFARMDGLDVVYSEIPRERDGSGFVEYETEADLNNAVTKIDGREFRGVPIQCTASVQPERPRDSRYRSRSPPPYRGGRDGYGAPPPRRGGYDNYDSYDRRGPPRPYSTRGYRERSPPPPRDDSYYDRRGPPRPYASRPPVDDDPYYDRRGPPPPRAYSNRPPVDDYPPPRRGPPPAAYPDDPYSNGARGGAYDRALSPGPPPPRRRSPPPARGGGYDAGYGDRRGYW